MPAYATSSKPVDQPSQKYIGVAVIVSNDSANGGTYREAGMKSVGSHETEVARYGRSLSVSAAILIASEVGTAADAEHQMIVEESLNDPQLGSNARTTEGTGIAFVEI